MKLKKIISVALSVMMLAQPTTFVLADNNHWAQKSIDRMTSLGIVEGNEMGDFMPDNNITRAELFTILNRLTKISAISGNSIPDVAANAWYREETDKAVTDGYVAGYDDGTIRPENNITRAEAATLISRIFSANEYEASNFTDGASIGEWAKDGIDALSSMGVISGYDDGSFRPNDFVTRAEIVTMLDKLIGHIKNDRDSKELYGKTVEGNLIVTSGRFVLENVTVNGNVYITNGAVNDEVRLVNCKVTGDIFYGNNNTRAVVLENTTANAVTAGGKGGQIVLVGKTEISKIYSNGAKISGPDYEGAAIGEIIVNGDTTIGVDASKVTVADTSLVTVKDDARVSKLTVQSGGRNSEIKSTDGSIGSFETDAICTLNGSSVKPGYSTNNVGNSSASQSENYQPTQSGGSTGGGGGGGGGGGASSGAAPGVTTPYEITAMGVNVTRKESGDYAGPALITYDKDTANYNVNVDYDDVDVKFDITFTTGSTVKLNGIVMTSGTPYTMTNLPSGKTVVDILVFNGIQQKYAYKVTITKGAPAPAGTVDALNTKLSGLANAGAAQADAIAVLQAFKNAELDTAQIGLVGAYKTAYDTLATGGALTQRQLIDMVADVNGSETADNSAVLSAVASVSDSAIKTLSISDGTPSYVYSGSLDSASVANLNGAVDFYINVPSEGTYTIATIGSSVNGDKATVTVNDASTPLATADLNPSHDDATAEEVAHGTVTLPAGLNKITVESTSQSADSKITSLLVAGEDSVYPPVGVVAIRLSSDSTVRHLNTSRTNTPYVGGEYNVNADAWKATYDDQSCYRIQLTTPLTTYVYAPVAGNYTLYTIASRSQWGPVNGTALVNGTTTITGKIQDTAGDSTPERNSWGTVALNEGYNTITFNSNTNNHRLVGLDIAGPEVRVGFNSVSVDGATFTPAFDEATTAYSASIDYDVDEITFNVDFTRFSKVKINTNAITSGTPYTVTGIPSGDSSISMKLYDENDVEVEEYIFSITKGYASPAGTIEELNDMLADTYATPIDIMQAIANAKLVGAEIEQVVNYQAAYAAVESTPLTQKELQAGITAVNGTATADASSVLPYVLAVNDDSNMTTASVASATPSYVYYGSGTSLTEKALDDKIEFYVNAETAGTYTLFANAKTLSESSKLTVSVNGGAETQLSLTSSYVDNEIYAGTLNQGLNKITLSSDASSNITVKSIKVLGANVIFIPAGVTAKTVSDTEITAINFNTDDCFAGGVGNEVASFNGAEYEFVGVVPTVTVYLDVAAAGTYKLVSIAKRNQYGSNSTTFTVTDSQGNTNAVSGKISDDTIGTPARVTLGEITLAAGTNTIKISSTTNHDKVGGLMIVPDSITWPPVGVTPIMLSADSTVAHYVTTATTNQPFINYSGDGTVLANTTAIGTWNMQTYDEVETGLIQLSRSTMYYVNAPVAGKYKLNFVGSGISGGGYVAYKINGGTQSANYTGIGTEGWDVVKEISMGEIPLNAGVNTIQFKAPGQTAVRAIKITGPAYVELPSGATAYDISTAGDKVKYTFEAEEATADTFYTAYLEAAPFDVYVNAAEAGDYYFTTHTQSEWDKTDKFAYVLVNNMNAKTINYNQGYNFGYTYTGGVPKNIKAVTFKVTLNAGLNKISVYADHSHIKFDKFELRNYEMAGTTDVQSNSVTGLYGTGLETTTTVASSPKVVTRSVVYDAIPQNATTLDVSTLFVVKGKRDAQTIVAASYDVNGKLLDTKITTANALWNNFMGAKTAGLNVSGAATVKVMLLDGFANLTNLDDVTFTAAQ